jgi:catechol 2,3-dioxygenase-like lactoylglutathione lyase family enzyme
MAATKERRMSPIIDQLQREYQRGQMSRRDFTLALSALVMGSARSALAQGQGPAFQARTLNHVTIAVSSIKRSQAFYQKIFGMPVQVTDPVPALSVGSGPQFVAIMERPGRPVGADHFCFGIDHFDVDRVVKTLADHGITTKPNMRAGMRNDKVPEIALRDPDNLTVQIQDVSYCAGSGVLGSLCEASIEHPPTTAPAAPVPIAIKTINSVRVAVSDVPKTVAFYQRVLDLKLQPPQGQTQILTVGSGPQFVALSPTMNGAKPGISHFCLGVEHFDATRIMKTLTDNGVTGRQSMRDGTTEVFLSDPDGISLQLQDVSYCGGSGALGNVCNSRGGK